MTEELIRIVDQNNAPTNPVPQELNQLATKSENLSLWTHFDNKLSKVITTTSSSANAILIMRHYLEMPYLPRGENSLEFWEKHKIILPELYKMHLK